MEICHECILEYGIAEQAQVLILLDVYLLSHSQAPVHIGGVSMDEANDILVVGEAVGDN